MNNYTEWTTDLGTTFLDMITRFIHYLPTLLGGILVGDASKARNELGWKPRVMFRELVEMMADADLQAVQSNEPFVLSPVPE